MTTPYIADPVKRKCRYCGGRFLAERYSKVLGCPECCPTIQQAIEESEPKR